MIDSIRKLYIKHNGDNAKLGIFSFIPQRQRIQHNFMTDSTRLLYIPNSKHWTMTWTMTLLWHWTMTWTMTLNYDMI